MYDWSCVDSYVIVGIIVCIVGGMYRRVVGDVVRGVVCHMAR